MPMTTDELVKMIKEISRQTIDDYFYQQQLDAQQQEQDEEAMPSNKKSGGNAGKNGMTDTGQRADKIDTDVQITDYLK